MWVPLHVHSEYSILDAAASIQGLVDKAKEFKMPALALTDHGNLFGLVDFYKACKEAKIKPILGCELYIAPTSRFEKKKEPGLPISYHLTLLAKNKQGYHNLCKLTSIGYTEGFYYYPRIDAEILKAHSEGLVCLSGDLSSCLAHEIIRGSESSFMEQVLWHKEIFGEDYYFELQRHPMTQDALENEGVIQESWLYQQYQDFIANQEKVNQALIKTGKELGIKVVASNDTHYIDRADWKAHEILLNIQSGEPCEIIETDSYGNPKRRIPNPKRRTYSSHEYDFKSPEQMQALFSDIPEAISNTLEVAEKCQAEIDLKTKHYPIYLPPDIEGKEYTKEEQIKSVEQYLWKLCEEGIPVRYTPERLAKVAEIYPGQDPMDVVRKRLEYEMSVIVPKGMCDYLLIVWDFINWAKRTGIPMGPGRGSGAGSIILYLIGITDIEPLRFHLFFERFINPERISYPDIDVDICMDRRGEVINYTMNKYGKDNIAQIVTFNTMKAKSVLRDVARVLSVPLAKVNSIVKLVPEDLNITLDKALEKDADLRQMYDTDEDTHRIIDLGKSLEGFVRNTGIHAAGIIISGQPLTNLIPVCISKDSEMPVTQYSMKPVEMVGMLKVDFLGLKTLTCIQICVDAIAATTKKVIDWVNLPLDDVQAFAIMNQGKTMGVFQLESGGMQDLARQLHLDKFEEIIAVVSLYRPGPMDMIPSFINRKHGREPIEYEHPWMKEILSETYGIMVYQEQVMQIASKLANFSLGEGDVLRRAMGKKDSEQMAKQREKFRLGAIQNNIDDSVSMQIFDKMEKFAAYGFNKSHAAAYGFLSYVTAYFKGNYPKEWMAALMTCDSHDLTKVAKFIRECQAMHIPVLPPDINEAGQTFTAAPEGIRFAISGIKGIGSGVVEGILQERIKNGKFTSLYNFLKRIDTKRTGKKVIEHLIDAGAFDFTKWSRDGLQLGLDQMFEAVVSEQKEAASGFMDLFAKSEELGEKRFEKEPKVTSPRSAYTLLLKEKELLGFFLTGHPMSAYQSVIQRLSCVALGKIEEMEHDNVFRSAFIVETVQIRFSTKSQKKFAILTISDGYDGFELPIWAEMYEEKQHLLKENQLLYAVLQVDKKEETPRLSCRWVDDLTQANDAMMEACDNAYDKAKLQAARFAKNKAAAAEKPPSNIPQKNANASQKNEKKAPAQTKVTAVKRISIQIDADEARLSHILDLKAAFDKERGETPVKIEFVSKERTIADLMIDPPWGIELTSGLQSQIKLIKSVKSVTLES